MLVQHALYAWNHLSSPKFDIYILSSGALPRIVPGLRYSGISFSDAEPYSTRLPSPLADSVASNNIPFSPVMETSGKLN